TVPGWIPRRSVLIGNVPISTAGRSRAVSVGVGACTTGSTSEGIGDPALVVDGDRPGEPPRGALAFLGRTAGEDLRGEAARTGEQTPSGGAFAVRAPVGGGQVG